MRVDLSKKYAEYQSKNQTTGLDFNAARARMAQAKAIQPVESGWPTEAPQTVQQGFKQRLESITSRIASFTGGNKLAQGLGQGLAMSGTKKTLDDIQKNEGEMQTKLIEAIRKNKKEGRDTSRLEASLKALTGGIADTGAGAEELYNPNKLTGKQVVGDALQLGTTVGTLGSLPGAAKNVVGATGVKAGIIQGAKSGAKAGLGVGALSGTAQGLKQDKNALGIIKDTAIGAVSGGVAGGILGGALGGAGGALKNRAINKIQKESDFRLDLVAPKATEKVKIQALQEGRITEQGLLKASKILPSKRDKDLAEAVKDVVSAKRSPGQNIKAIDAKISDINSGVKAYVAKNKVPFNANQLRTKLNSGKDELRLIFASDKNAEKTYDAVVKEFMKHVEKKDTAGLFQARQAVDNIPAIKKLLDSQGLGENVKKEVVLTVRAQANKYIASQLPKGNAFRETLLRESKMIEALGNIAEKEASAIGLNQLQALTKKYPVLKAILGGLAGGLGLGAVGIGSSIIGSSD